MPTRQRWRRKPRFPNQAADVVLCGDAVDPCSGIHPSFADGRHSRGRANVASRASNIDISIISLRSLLCIRSVLYVVSFGNESILRSVNALVFLVASWLIHTSWHIAVPHSSRDGL